MLGIPGQTIGQLPRSLDQSIEAKSNLKLPLELPPELMVQILSFLPHQSLEYTCLVNHEWRVISLDVAHNFYGRDFINRLGSAAPNNLPLQTLLQEARESIYETISLNAIVRKLFSVITVATGTIRRTSVSPLSIFKKTDCPSEQIRQDFFNMIMKSFPLHASSELLKSADEEKFTKGRNTRYKLAITYFLSEKHFVKALEVALKVTAFCTRELLIKRVCWHLDFKSPKPILKFLLKIPPEHRLKCLTHKKLSLRKLNLSLLDLLFLFKFAMKFKEPVRKKILKQSFAAWQGKYNRYQEFRDEGALNNFLRGVDQLDQTNPLVQTYLLDFIQELYIRSDTYKDSLEAFKDILTYMHNAEFIEKFSSEFVTRNFFGRNEKSKAEGIKRNHLAMIDSDEKLHAEEDVAAREPPAKRARK